METFKNFIVGLLVTVLVFIACMLCFILWPFVLSIGSVMLFVAIGIIAVILLFYIIVFIGYVIRKGLKKG